MKLFKLATSTAAGLVFLSACGGGDVSVNNIAIPIDPPAVVQGFWSGSVTTGPDSATKATAVVTPALTAWVVFDNGTTVTGLAKVALSAAAASNTEVSAQGSGSYFKLGTTLSKQAVALSATATTSGAFSGTLGTSTWAWQSNASYKTAALASDLVANWTGTAAGKAVSYNWTVDGNGALSGSSTTGCSYSGTVKPNAAGVAVFDVLVTEACSGVTKTLTGIATLTSAKSALAVAYTTTGDAEGSVLQLTKQP